MDKYLPEILGDFEKIKYSLIAFGFFMLLITLNFKRLKKLLGSFLTK